MPHLETCHQVLHERTVFDEKCLRLSMENQRNKVIVQQLTDHYICHLETSHHLVQKQEKQTSFDKKCVRLSVENPRNSKAIVHYCCCCFQIALEQ